MMKEEQFDKLWQRAEAEHYASELAAEYPGWRARQRRTATIAALALVVTGAALPMMLTGTQPSVTGNSYAAAYCNRADIADQYWVDMADNLLMEA